MGAGGGNRPAKKAQLTGRWRGETACCIASGPSLTRDQCDYIRDSGWRTIAINTSWRALKEADIIYAADGAWWHQNHHKTPRQAEKWTQDRNAHLNLGVNLVRSVRGVGLCTDPGVIHQGRNSGYQAINLAYHLGAARIVLVGYDMQHTDGRRHWFGDHPPSLTNCEGINAWVPLFGPLAADLEREGVDVVNASPTTALTCFRRQALETITWR